jgi:cell division protein FtsQ
MSNKKSRKQRGSTGRPAARDAAAGHQDGSVEPSAGPVWTRLAHAVKLASGVLFVAAVSTALALGLHHYARTTPRFAITDLSVEGTRRLSREDILGTVELELGENIFTFDTSAAEGKLRRSPWVRSAQVRRKLPGTIEISVSEHHPAALLVALGTTLLVSEDGVPIKEVAPADPHDLPLITGISTDELRRDRRAELGRVSGALELLQEYAALPLARNYPAEEVHIREDGAAVLVVGGAGLSLYLGAPPWTASLHRAMRIVGRTAEEGGTPGIVFLDSEAHPERVVVRLR